MLEPHPKRLTLLLGAAQQNHSPQVLSTLNPYQWQLGSWKLNVRSVHLPIGELLCRKRWPQWRHVPPVESMPITRYIQRFCLTHLDRLKKILHLRLGLLHWTLQWQLFPDKCWAAGDSSQRSYGVHIYSSQAPHPIEDWHATFLQAAKRAAFSKSHASLCSSMLISPRGIVRCHYRHPQQCLHSWCVDAVYRVTYHLDIFPITLLDLKISKEVCVHHVPPIRILSVIRKVGNQGGSLAGSTLRHSSQIFIFVKNDVVVSWQMNN